MLNLPVSAREALKEHRIPFTDDETWLKLSSMYLTERAQHLHAHTRPVCSNVKSVLTLSLTFIDLFFMYLFHKDKLKPPLLHSYVMVSVGKCVVKAT